MNESLYIQPLEILHNRPFIYIISFQLLHFFFTEERKQVEFFTRTHFTKIVQILFDINLLKYSFCNFLTGKNMKGRFVLLFICSVTFPSPVSVNHSLLHSITFLSILILKFSDLFRPLVTIQGRYNAQNGSETVENAL